MGSRNRPDETESAAEVPVSVGSSLFTMPGHGAPRVDEPTIISNRPPLASPVLAVTGDVGKTLIGERLNHFELQEFIGGGGMGAVFRALDTDLNRTVALKVLARDQSADDETVRRFRNEAQSAARLDHDNIARVYYVGEDRGIHYIAFEYIEGSTIRNLVEQRGALPLAEAISYTLQISEALGHASSRDVVHRDIKPSNVLITSQGRAKLVDMGLARLHQVAPAENDLTASGVTLGTFDYISPEQARDPRMADVRSDLYSLGCTLYYMLTARPPFPEGTVLQKLLRHQGVAAPDPSEFNKDLPEEISRIVRKMMAKDPRRRYQTPAELLADLFILAEDLGWQPQGAGSLVWLTPQSSRTSAIEKHLPWALPLAALVCIALLLDFLASSRGRDTDFAPPPLARAERLAVTPIDEDVAGNPAAQESTASDDSALRQGAGPGAKQAADASDSPRPQQEAEVEATGDDSAHQSPGAGQAAEDDAASVSAEEDDTSQAEVDSAADPDRSVDTAVETPDDAPTEAATSANDDSSSEQPAVESANVSVPPPNQPDLIVGDGTAANEYPTLKAACEAAKNGDVIELRFNGRRDEPRPIRIGSLRLTIRSGDQYKPVVVFRPTEIDPAKYARSMLLLAGGQLNLINVALELDFPPLVPADTWTLVETQRADVRLERCSLTIRNASESAAAYQKGVAFIRTTPAPGEKSMMMTDPVVPPPEARPISLELRDCIVRGEAVFLRTVDTHPINLSWHNGLLATTEQFLVASATQMTSRGAGMLQVDLRHITAVTRAGLCLVTGGPDTRTLPKIEMRSADCILVGAPESPLVEIAFAVAGDLQDQFSWNGDTNFYEGYQIFLKTTATAQNAAPVRPFELWKLFWDSRESSPFLNRVGWKQLPAARRPMHTHTPEDYALDDRSANNLAKNSARNSRDVGCDLTALPALPSSIKGQGVTSADARPATVAGGSATPTP